MAATMTATVATAIGVLSVSDDSQADGKNGNSCQTKFDGCIFHRVFFVNNAASLNAKLFTFAAENRPGPCHARL